MALFTAAQCCGPVGSCMSSTAAVQACCALRTHIENCRWSQVNDPSSRSVSCRNAVCYGSCGSKSAIAYIKDQYSSHWLNNPPGLTELSLKAAECRTQQQDKVVWFQTRPMDSVTELSTRLAYDRVRMRVTGDGVLANNIKGTSDDKAPFGGSWLRFLMDLCPEDADGLQCAVAGCPNLATHGAHVAVHSDDKDAGCRWPAIAGFCAEHKYFNKNSPPETLHLKQGSPLVLTPANICMDFLASLLPLITHLRRWLSSGTEVAHPTIGWQHVIAAATVGPIVAHDIVKRTQEMQHFLVGLAMQLEQGPSVLAKAGLSFEQGLEQAAEDWPCICKHLLQPKLAKQSTRRSSHQLSMESACIQALRCWVLSLCHIGRW